MTISNVPQPNTLTWPFSKIKANLLFNVRTQYDAKKIKELADSIESQGLETPLKVTQNGGEHLELVSGFCRYRALELLKWGSKPVPVHFVKYETPAKKFLSNLAENEGRTDVSSFDLAKRYHELEQGIVLEGHEAEPPVTVERKEIAKATTQSVSHIGNLIRSYRNLSEDSKKIWCSGFTAGGKRHEIPLSFVFKLSHMNHEEQEAELSALIESMEKSEGKAKRKKKVEEEEDGPSGPSKSEVRSLYAKLEARISEGGVKGMELAYLEGKFQAFRFFLGEISSRGLGSSYDK